MHQPNHPPAPKPGEIVPVPAAHNGSQPGACSAQPGTQPQPANTGSHRYSHRYGQLQQQMVEQCHSLSASIHQHSPILEAVGEQSLHSWYNCRQTASLLRQQAFAAVDQATTVDQEIAQLNRNIQQQLQQFDQQLNISAQTLRQEVAQKVGQFHRHIQQQSNSCRDRLHLEAENQPCRTETQREQAQQLFHKTTLRPAPHREA